MVICISFACSPGQAHLSGNPHSAHFLAFKKQLLFVPLGLDLHRVLWGCQAGRSRVKEARP